MRYAVPLATILFCWITVRAEVRLLDGGNVNLYGFPLPWHCWSTAASLDYRIDPLTFVLDLTIHVLVVAALLRGAPGQLLVRARGANTLLITWAAAIISLGWLALSLLGIGSYSLGPVDSWPHTVVAYGLHLGIDYPY